MAFEWWIMRAALAWFAVQATPAGLPWHSQPSPVGVAKFFDLTWLGDPATPGWMGPLLLLLGWLLALGVAPLAGAAGLLVLHTAVGTFANSQGGGGGSHHTTNLIGLMLLGQVLACLYRDARALRDLRHVAAAPPDQVRLHGDDRVTTPPGPALHALEQEGIGTAVSDLQIGRNRGLKVVDQAGPDDLRRALGICLLKVRKRRFDHHLAFSVLDAGASFLASMGSRPRATRALLG